MDSNFARLVIGPALLLIALCACGPSGARDASFGSMPTAPGRHVGNDGSTGAIEDAAGAREDVESSRSSAPPGGGASASDARSGSGSTNTSSGSSGGGAGSGPDAGLGSESRDGRAPGQGESMISGEDGGAWPGTSPPSVHPKEDAAVEPVRPIADSGVATGIAESASWIGTWTGQANYTVTVVKDPLTGRIEKEEHSFSATLQVDELVEDAEGEGWAALVGRLAASDCVVSAGVHGMVFFGDAISPVAYPIVSGAGGGLDRMGRMVGLTIAGDRRADTLHLKVAFESEGQRVAPCDNRELSLTLSRTR
jgi:hypothetical protein